MAHESQSEFGRELEKAQAGHGSAVWRLVNGVSSYLNRRAAHLLRGNKQLARFATKSDLVQQTKVIGARELPAFRGLNLWVFKGWLRTILRNEALRLLRWGRVEKNLPAQGNSTSNFGPGAADSSLLPDRIASEREERDLFRRVRHELSPADRRLLDGRVPPNGDAAIPYSVLADELGTTDTALKKRFERLLDFLREGVSLLAIIERPGFPPHYAEILRGQHFVGWRKAEVAERFEVSDDAAALLIERAEATFFAAKRRT